MVNCENSDIFYHISCAEKNARSLVQNRRYIKIQRNCRDWNDNKCSDEFLYTTYFTQYFLKIRLYFNQTVIKKPERWTEKRKHSVKERIIT